MKNKNEQILKICFERLKYFNYSERTIEIYVHYITKFLLSVDKYGQHLTSNDFQFYLNTYEFKSISQQNQIISSIKFLYEKVLNKKYNKIDFTRPRNEKHLPRIIDSDVILNLISKIENLKHKTIISLTYSVGLRVSEIVNLKIEDIDSKRMLIYINNSKGRKDRIVPLSKNILKLLREYFLKYKPVVYLFNGQKSLKYSIRSCQNIYKKYIDNNGHIHTLRHSCFTTLLESGTDLRIIQKIAGHLNSKTTEIYTHVSNQLLNKVKLPI